MYKVWNGLHSVLLYQAVFRFWGLRIEILRIFLEMLEVEVLAFPSMASLMAGMAECHTIFDFQTEEGLIVVAFNVVGFDPFTGLADLAPIGVFFKNECAPPFIVVAISPGRGIDEPLGFNARLILEALPVGFHAPFHLDKYSKIFHS